MTAVADTWFCFGRLARNIVRQPIWIFIMLVQPFFWLLLYSQLFRRITDLPGFGTDSYIQFLTPGIVVMTAFFTALWSGMGMIQDIERGVVARFLATPARRASLVLAHVLMTCTTAIIQALIILALAAAMGAGVDEGVLGWLVVLVSAALVAGGFAGLSNGIALATRREETMIAVSNFVGLPLMFLSTVLINADLMPGWIRWAARFNPVDWSVHAAREAMAGADWAEVALRLGLLAAFLALTASFATWSFRAYRRTL